MSNAILKGNASGTGSVTLESPNTNSDRTISLPDADGTAMVSGNMPAFSAYSTSNQSVTQSTWTKVTLDTEVFDTNNNFSSSRFTPTVAGYYQVQGSINLDYAGAGGTVGFRTGIYKNGSIIAYQAIKNTNAGAYGTLIASVLVYMNGSTDYLELYGFDGNATPIFASGASETWFSGNLVRAE